MAVKHLVRKLRQWTIKWRLCLRYFRRCATLIWHRTKSFTHRGRVFLLVRTVYTYDSVEFNRRTTIMVLRTQLSIIEVLGIRMALAFFRRIFLFMTRVFTIVIVGLVSWAYRTVTDTNEFVGDAFAGSSHARSGLAVCQHDVPIGWIQRLWRHPVTMTTLPHWLTNVLGSVPALVFFFHYLRQIGVVEWMRPSLSRCAL